MYNLLHSFLQSYPITTVDELPEVELLPQMAYTL